MAEIRCCAHTIRRTAKCFGRSSSMQTRTEFPRFTNWMAGNMWCSAWGVTAVVDQERLLCSNQESLRRRGITRLLYQAKYKARRAAGKVLLTLTGAALLA